MQNELPPKRRTIIERLEVLAALNQNSTEEEIKASLNKGHQSNNSNLNTQELIRQELGQIITTVEMQKNLNMLRQGSIMAARILTIATNFEINLASYETIDVLELLEEIKQIE